MNVFPSSAGDGVCAGTDTGELVIGRSGTSADIEINDPRVRADHARLRLVKSGRWLIRASAGRVFVDGRRVAAAELVEGQVFVVGQTSLTASVDSAGPSPGPAVRSSAGRGLSVALRGVSVFRGGRALVDDITLTVEPGELVAVVGPSGAGKSSMMGVLLGELTPDRGTVLIGGSALGTGRVIRDQIRYVPQSDSDDLYRDLSVVETLRFAARLRSTLDTPRAEILGRVDAVLERLGLTGQRRCPVRILSGGQRRRVSIGVELVGRPQLLVLDEPTSGLDLGRDRDITNRLRTTSRTLRCTIIMVTHSVAQLDAFDKVVVLAAGGRVHYCGPPAGAPAGPGHIGWADCLAALDSGEPRRVPVQATGRRNTAAADGYGATPLAALPVCLQRQALLVWRRGLASLIVLFGLPVTGALMATFASAEGLRGAQATQPLAILVTVAALTGASLTYQDLVTERAILKRDWRVGASTAALLWAKAIVYGVMCLILSAVMTAVIARLRPMPIGDYGPRPWAVLFLALSGTMISSMGIGLVVSAAASTLERAVSFNTLLAVLQVALNGSLFRLPAALHFLTSALPARLGMAAIGSYADLNLERRSVGLYTDPLWTHRPQYQWLPLLGTLVVLAISTALAIRVLERRWERGAHGRLRPVGPSR